MVFCKELFLKVDNSDEIIDLLSKGTAVYDVYLLCVPEKGKNLLHIMSTYEALKEINTHYEYVVIGMAQGKQGAYELASEIIGQWIDKHNNLVGFKKFYIS